jgi:hypothetical protein
VAIRDRTWRHNVVSFVAKLVGLGTSGSNVHTVHRLVKRHSREMGKRSPVMMEAPKPYGSNQQWKDFDETSTEPLRADGDRCKKEK